MAKPARAFAAAVATIAALVPPAAAAPPTTPVTLAAPSATAAAPNFTIYNAPNSQDSEDVVTASAVPIANKDVVEFVLTTASQVTWRKELVLCAMACDSTPTGTSYWNDPDQGANFALDGDYTQDSKHTTKVMPISRTHVTGLVGVTLYVKKAKAFGNMWVMYPVKVPADHLGYRITLTWSKD
ncbi:hypothetical protein IL992_14565 [Microbispora sp. NEAU-D428]|uniref:hypothetical protein n=1 Tax=Microbispora sitophila TaxID=2771537 RepID=UPI0018688B7F|nr:hypothetical protein [Microbispora sitophila]MBE3010408.1 hypothetical protein [Microbispora sitophila]